MNLLSNLASFRYAHTMRQQSSCSRCASLSISHQSMMVLVQAMSSWGSSLGFAMMSSNSASRTCVFTSCVIPSCILFRKAEAFALVAFLFLFSSRWSPLCVELKCFCSKGCKDVAEVILTVRLNPVQEEPVVECLSEQHKGTVSIFCVPVIRRQ